MDTPHSGDNVNMNEEQTDEKAPEIAAGNQPPSESERTESLTSEAADGEIASPSASGKEAPRNDPPPQDPRRRLRELLAIPDHQRTDAIWDEIIELEICLAPGNRIQGSPAEPGRRQGQGPQGQGRRPEQPRRQDQTPGAKPAKRFFKKPKRPPGAPPKT